MVIVIALGYPLDLLCISPFNRLFAGPLKMGNILKDL